MKNIDSIASYCIWRYHKRFQYKPQQDISNDFLMHVFDQMVTVSFNCTGNNQDLVLHQSKPFDAAIEC